MDMQRSSCSVHASPAESVWASSASSGSSASSAAMDIVHDTHPLRAQVGDKYAPKR